MEQKVVSSLERRIEKAIAEAIMAIGPKRLPLLPSQQTMHLMAKAAVSVYEAAAQATTPSLPWQTAAMRRDRDRQQCQSRRRWCSYWPG